MNKNYSDKERIRIVYKEDPDVVKWLPKPKDQKRSDIIREALRGLMEKDMKKKLKTKEEKK